MSSKAQSFYLICQRVLGDLLSAYGFSATELSVDAAVLSITTRFYGEVYAIECIWDERETTLEVKVARLQKGRPPKEFAVFADGQRVRDHLTQILLRRGVRNFGFRRFPVDIPVDERWRTQLEDYARLLRKHGGTILDESADPLR